MPALNPACAMMAPAREPERFLQWKKSRLTKSMLNTQMIVGAGYKSHWLLTYTSPKCEICVNAKAELSTSEAFLSPKEAAKLE